MKKLLSFLFPKTTTRMKADALASVKLVLKVNGKSLVENSVGALSQQNLCRGDDPSVLRFTFRTRHNQPFSLIIPPT
jgi:hypothetical protein